MGVGTTGITFPLAFTPLGTARPIDPVRRIRKEKEHLQTGLDDITDAIESVADDERSAVAEVVLSALEGEWLFYMADLLWLGLDGRLSSEMHDRQVLAASLFYMRD